MIDVCTRLNRYIHQHIYGPSLSWRGTFECQYVNSARNWVLGFTLYFHSAIQSSIQAATLMPLNNLLDWTCSHSSQYYIFEPAKCFTILMSD